MKLALLSLALAEGFGLSGAYNSAAARAGASSAASLQVTPNAKKDGFKVEGKWAAPSTRSAFSGTANIKSFDLAGTYNSAAARAGASSAASLHATPTRGLLGKVGLKIVGKWAAPSTRKPFFGTATLQDSPTATWTEKAHAALDCDHYGTPCLAEKGHACTGKGNDPNQCSWDSVAEAKAYCAGWEECEGIYCNTWQRADGELLCFARGHASIEQGVQSAVRSTDTIYLKSKPSPVATLAGTMTFPDGPAAGGAKIIDFTFSPSTGQIQWSKAGVWQHDAMNTTLVGTMNFPDGAEAGGANNYKFSFSASTGQIEWNNGGGTWQHDTPAPKPPAPPASDCQDCTCQSNDGGWEGAYSDCTLQSRSDCLAGYMGYCVECNSKAEYNGKHYKSECAAPKPPTPPAVDCQDCTCTSNDGGWDGTYSNCVLQPRSECDGYCVECNSKAEYIGLHYKSECPAPKPPAPKPPAGIVDCKWTAPTGNRYEFTQAEFPVDGRDWALAAAADEKYTFHYNFCKGTKTYGTDKRANFHCEKGETAMCVTSAVDTKGGYSYPLGDISKFATPTVEEIPASEVATLVKLFANATAIANNTLTLGKCTPGNALRGNGNSKRFNVAMEAGDDDGDSDHCLYGCNGRCGCCLIGSSSSSCACNWGCCNTKPPAPPSPPARKAAGVRITYHHPKGAAGLQREAVVNILCDATADQPVFSAVHTAGSASNPRYVFNVRSIVGCAMTSEVTALE